LNAPVSPSGANPEASALNFFMKIFAIIGAFLLDIVEIVVIALAMFVVMYIFLFQPHQVRGLSMYPTFYDSDYLLTDKLTYRLAQPKRGEVIIFKAPNNEEYDYIKRIIGLPGETVKVSNNHVYINDKVLDEPYLPSTYQTFGGKFWQEGQSIPVPDGQYFVLGDNREHSSDSREWGPVPRANIIGKAWVRYWPPSRAGIIPSVTYAE
jgi:signal peptidase I